MDILEKAIRASGKLGGVAGVLQGVQICNKQQTTVKGKIFGSLKYFSIQCYKVPNELICNDKLLISNPFKMRLVIIIYNDDVLNIITNWIVPISKRFETVVELEY